jgi:hypothetical protein
MSPISIMAARLSDSPALSDSPSAYRKAPRNVEIPGQPDNRPASSCSCSRVTPLRSAQSRATIAELKLPAQARSAAVLAIDVTRIGPMRTTS